MAGSAHTNEPDPNDSLQTYGAVLQGFRERAGLTQEALAPLVRYSPSFVASVEQGRRLPPEDFVCRADKALDAHGILVKAARRLCRQPGLAAWFRKWAGLEENAVSLYTYECRVVPGLLQTAAYARTLFEHRIPLLTDEQIEAQLLARQDRQRKMRERVTTAFSFIVDEHVFLRGTGGPEATAELLDHVVELAEGARNVEVQVMPLGRGVHAGMNGPIQLLETPTNQWFAYSEGQESGQLISDPKTISVLQMRYAKLRTQALTPGDSVGLLKRLRGAL
ncbi:MULTISPECIES: helix-turn-helix transcriptional regulator [unclassified Streptomyces]|uniref:helix-turn-helix domain-containing protein n=1 Tax=unclassified Streptomyces TaxID=2593676 RepID=UPI00278C66FA|nr:MULTISPECIES: helix-turn-helix transcriptional regulator [unclassified Streptomyces]